MSCLEHICRDCGNNWFDNKPGEACARCGSTNVSTHFDEDLADHYEDYGDNDPDI